MSCAAATTVLGSTGSSPNYLSTATTSPSNGGSSCGGETTASSSLHDADVMSGPQSLHSNTDASSASSNESHLLNANLSTKCTICEDTFTQPKVLDCFHSFCLSCLEKQILMNQTIVCPECQSITNLSQAGVSALPNDFAIYTILEANVADTTLVKCTGCKSKDTGAVARCFDCANYLCPNCVMAHQFMHCFEGHHVKTFEEIEGAEAENISTSGGGTSTKTVNCSKHKSEVLRFFCTNCDLPVCKDCVNLDHKLHDYDSLADCSLAQVEQIRHLVGAAKVKANNIRSSKKGVEHSSNRLQMQFEKAQNEVNETYSFYQTALEERKLELLKELETGYKAKQVTLSGQMSQMQTTVDRLYMGCEFIDKLMKYATPTEALLFKRQLNARVQELMAFQPEMINITGNEMDFVSNYQAIQIAVKNTFGYVRQSNSDNPTPGNKQQPIARPTSNGFRCGNLSKPLDSAALSIGKFSGSNNSLSSLTSGFQFNSHDTNQPTTTAAPYDAWSSAGLDTTSTVSSGSTHDIFTSLPMAPPDNHMVDLTTKLITANIYPPKSQIKRQKMIYHCKFGEFGVMEGQFTEPSGVAVNAQNDIIVADTNNHRIQIFDREGRFKFQFGECGKRDGQLLYPNRVAVVRQTGDIVVTERSPTHQVQIFNQYGQFVRKFGANVLQHPRGVTVDTMGRIVIVECKVMRVIIFDLFGNILQKFGCSKHLEFPNGVIVNDKEEIFISDNRAHCVKVFSYQGQFLRQIGGEGISNYPIGVGINALGEVLIADNHNNFNLTVFTQDGQLISALESKVKHAQCFDVSLLDDNSIVLASKDYRLYVYRYSQPTQQGYPFMGLHDVAPLTLDTFN